MLINCPRCGFSQPQDQYCAQCGVDMQAFKPKSAPWYVRFFGSPAVQIAALLIAAVLVGQNIIRSKQPQGWVQKMANFQGMNRSDTAETSSEPSEADENNLTGRAVIEREAVTETSSASRAAEALGSLQNQEIDLNETTDSAATANDSGEPAEAATLPGGEPAEMSFKLTYAEITYEMLQDWVRDSSEVGLYQNLSDYSAGILPDFSRYRDNLKQNLKSASLSVRLGSTNSNISGTMNDEGSQLIGLITAVEFRTTGRELVHGNISITRNNGQTRETYPAEFHLPRGAAFFIVGALKRDSLNTDRERLNMPPFQIFKSQDFMTRKTEFVIVLEPEYK